MKCNDVMRLLASSPAGMTASERLNYDAARIHFQSCRVCQSRLDRFSSAILSLADDEISCAECSARLHAYVEAESAGQDAAQLFPVLAAHLGRCGACAQERRLLQQTVRELRAGGVLAPAIVTATAPHAEEGRAQRIWQAASRAGDVHRLFTDITIAIWQTVASFERLAAPLAAQPVPVVARPRAGGHLPVLADQRLDRRPGEEQPATARERQHLYLPDGDANVAIDLYIGHASDGRAAVRFAVSQISPARPLAGASVTVYDSDNHLLVRKSAGDDGAAAFDDLGVGRYVIQIEQERRVWSLPLSLSSGGSGSQDR